MSEKIDYGEIAIMKIKKLKAERETRTIDLEKDLVITSDGRIRFHPPEKLKPHSKVRIVGKIIVKNGA